jgi:hypothetical protein
MFRSYDHLQAEIEQCSKLNLVNLNIFPPEDGHKTETCSGY